jgi:AcrR family transcriptional regulator
MDDIASEVGVSRPSVYRYFADRDDLLIELITRHARAIITRAHKSMARQDNIADQILEGDTQHQIAGDQFILVAPRAFDDCIEITGEAAGVGGVVGEQIGPPVDECIGDQRRFG